MSKKQYTQASQIKNGKMVDKLLKKDGWEVIVTGKNHRVAKKDNNILGYHAHGEFKRGIQCVVFKALKEYGVILVPIALLFIGWLIL